MFFIFFGWEAMTPKAEIIKEITDKFNYRDKFWKKCYKRSERQISWANIRGTWMKKKGSLNLWTPLIC